MGSDRIIMMIASNIRGHGHMCLALKNHCCEIYKKGVNENIIHSIVVDIYALVHLCTVPVIPRNVDLEFGRARRCSRSLLRSSYVPCLNSNRSVCDIGRNHTDNERSSEIGVISTDLHLLQMNDLSAYAFSQIYWIQHIQCG
jgi:hypothetical protein